MPKKLPLGREDAGGGGRNRGKGQRSSCGGSPFPGTWTLNITSLTPMALSTCSGQALDSQAPCALPPLLDVVQV